MAATTLADGGGTLSKQISPPWRGTPRFPRQILTMAPEEGAESKQIGTAEKSGRVTGPSQRGRGCVRCRMGKEGGKVEPDVQA